MSAFIDTSVTVRYLSGDTPDLADRAAQIVEGAPVLYITDVVIVETAHVLRSFYKIQREAVVDGLIALVRRENVRTFRLNKDFVLHGLMLGRPSNRVSVPDAMIWAAARSSEMRDIYSFDLRFPGEGISLLRTFGG